MFSFPRSIGFLRLPRIFNPPPGTRFAVLSLFGVSLFIVSGCYTLDVVKAFDGKFDAIQNNKVINEYCQSCHIHKDFDPGAHVADVRKQYKSKFFQSADECRACHYVEKEFSRNELLRKTRWPAEVARGKYRDFERDYMKDRKK